MRIKDKLVQVLAFLITMICSNFAVAEEKVSHLVGFGDSLMAGYELAPTESYTAQLEKVLKDKGYSITITNAGVSGDTSSGGRERAEWSVPNGVDGVILELGANDALRGISPVETLNNLDALISGFKARDIAVLLVGIMAPPNMGDDYAKQFNSIYHELAAKHNVDLYPFFLEGVVLNDQLLLSDGMHPNAEGVAAMVEKSLPTIEAFLSKIGVAIK